MTKTIEFRVEALGGERVKVSWQDDQFLYKFFALAEGDQLTKVLAAGGTGRRHILRSPLGSDILGESTTYLPQETHQHDILNATRYVREHKLVTQAITARDAKRAAQEAARIVETAARVREAFKRLEQEHHALADALGVHDVSYPEAINAVCAIDDASLFRLAVILGCD